MAGMDWYQGLGRRADRRVANDPVGAMRRRPVVEGMTAAVGVGAATRVQSAGTGSAAADGVGNAGAVYRQGRALRCCCKD